MTSALVSLVGGILFCPLPKGCRTLGEEDVYCFLYLGLVIYVCPLVWRGLVGIRISSSTKLGITSLRRYAADLCKRLDNSSTECSTIQTSTIQSISCCEVILAFTFFATNSSIIGLFSVARFCVSVARFGASAMYKYPPSHACETEGDYRFRK